MDLGGLPRIQPATLSAQTVPSDVAEGAGDAPWGGSGGVSGVVRGPVIGIPRAPLGDSLPRRERDADIDGQEGRGSAMVVGVAGKGVIGVELGSTAIHGGVSPGIPGDVEDGRG